MTTWDRFGDALDAEEAGRRIIAAAVKHARLRAGISQRQLAWRVGVNQSTISRLETGKLRAVRMTTLARIIGVLRLDPATLVPGEPIDPTRRMPGQRAAQRMPSQRAAQRMAGQRAA
jgi:transcriptional regulator with XRE-family HTH domain